MPLPQDIRPVFQDIQDTLIRSDAPWIEQTPLSKAHPTFHPKDGEVFCGVQALITQNASVYMELLVNDGSGSERKIALRNEIASLRSQ